METRRRAINIVEKLRAEGYIAYFAGGWVRDFLLQHPSDDIDIATNAPPEEVMRLFPQTVKVGVSFGVVMVLIDNIPFEVATFRKDGLYLYGRRPETITYSTPEEDAQRRDFTINGMFYDPLSEEIFDFVGGQADLKLGILRAIGDASERFREDRLRMVRAVRMTARFGFAMDPATRSAITEQASTLLPAVAMERIWQEFHKMAEYPNYELALANLHELGLLSQIFPVLQNVSLEALRSALGPLQSPCPAILGLVSLFSNLDEKALISVFEGLTAPRKDISLALFFRQPLPRTDYDYVAFLADPRFDQCKAFYAARLSPSERDTLQTQLIRLQPYIQKHRRRELGVSSKQLQNAGILPGPAMGKLLAESERISVEQKLEDSQLVLAELQRSALWPKSFS